MKTLVVGLGNPILGDDGVGWKVAEEVKKRVSGRSDVDVDYVSLGGISLMEHLVGYQRVILIDAFVVDASMDTSIGSISVWKLKDLPNYSAFHITSAHDTSLQKAIELGKSMGADLPEDIVVVGVSTKRAYEFSEELSPPIMDAIPQATRIALDALKEEEPKSKA